MPDSNAPSILWLVSGHGFGDLSQAGAVINALATVTTGFFVEVSSPLPNLLSRIGLVFAELGGYFDVLFSGPKKWKFKACSAFQNADFFIVPELGMMMPWLANQLGE